MHDARDTGEWEGLEAAEMLLSVLAEHLGDWREVYESFSPVDLETW